MSDQQFADWLSRAFRAKAIIDLPRHWGVDMTHPLAEWNHEFTCVVSKNGGMARVYRVALLFGIRVC